MQADGLLRRYMTIFESANMPAQLFILSRPNASPDLIREEDSSLARERIDVTADSLKVALMDVLLERRYYEWPAERYSLLYSKLDDFVNLCLEQPIAIEQSPVSGKSLIELAKAGAFLTVSYATGHDASNAHSIVPILDVGGSVIVIGSAMAVVNRVSDWLDHRGDRNRHR